MSAPIEPEKYSIDEMMARLKNRSSENSVEDGELVIRADGSQALRVRRKKRRSRQPHKEELRSKRRARMLQVSGFLILLLVALFGSGLAIVFANSTPFRENLAKKISSSSGATADLQQFRMNPTSANASMLTLNWPAGNVLESLTLRNLKAEISPISFLGRSMTGQEASAGEGTLTLRIPQTGQPVRETPAPKDILPIHFNHYNISKFHVTMGDSPTSRMQLRNAEATFITHNPASPPQLLLTRGNLTISGWPKLRMDRSHIEFRGNEADIISMRLRHETDSHGAFELSGTVSPYAADRPSTLAVHLESFLISGIAGQELGQLFSGRIDTSSSTTSNSLSFTPGPATDSSLSVTFHNTLASPLEVTGFPFLSGLARTLDDKWFALPVFDSEIRGILLRSGGNVSITDLNLENKSRMALRGMINMTSDRRLSGELEVGIAEGMITESGNRHLGSLFGPTVEGFRWITLKIGGTAKSPTDDFKNLYDSAMVTEVPAAPSGVPSFEELTRPK